jgi:alanine-synthesizing transaminase
MSKTYNMAGWRVGFCCGNEEMIKALATIKGYYDYGHFAPVQIASVIALRSCSECAEEQAKVYARRRDEVCKGLDRLGWTYDKPRASMFVWAKIKEEHLKGQSTLDFCLRLMDDAQVALAPGRAFGENGEGYVRIAVVENEQRLRQAMRNMERALVPRPPKAKREKASSNGRA